MLAPPLGKLGSAFGMVVAEAVTRGFLDDRGARELDSALLFIGAIAKERQCLAIEELEVPTVALSFLSHFSPKVHKMPTWSLNSVSIDPRAAIPS